VKNVFGRLREKRGLYHLKLLKCFFQDLIFLSFVSSRQSEVFNDFKKKSHHLAGKEFVRIITRDGVRDLLVPSSKSNAYTEVWPERELTRLQANAKVLTVEDKMQELRNRVQSNEKMKEESEQRKQKLREIDTAKVAKMEDQKEAFVDESDNAKLLDRAFLAKQEQVCQIFLSRELHEDFLLIKFHGRFHTICLTHLSIFFSLSI
jgi:hypothetical protein